MIHVGWLVALALLCVLEAVLCLWYTKELSAVHKSRMIEQRDAHERKVEETKSRAHEHGRQIAITDMVSAGMLLGVLGPYRFAWHQSTDDKTAVHAKSIVDEYKSAEMQGATGL